MTANSCLTAIKLRQYSLLGRIGAIELLIKIGEKLKKMQDGRGKHGKQGRKKGIKKISKSFSIDAEFALDKSVNSKLVNDLIKENRGQSEHIPTCTKITNWQSGLN